jgi:hypothetical protein
VEVYALGEAWYLVREGEKTGWCWRRSGEEWQVAKAALPAGARRAGLEELPGGLQEEMLAFAARAAAMGTRP